MNDQTNASLLQLEVTMTERNSHSIFRKLATSKENPLCLEEPEEIVSNFALDKKW